MVLQKVKTILAEVYFFCSLFFLGSYLKYSDSSKFTIRLGSACVTVGSCQNDASKYRREGTRPIKG